MRQRTAGFIALGALVALLAGAVAVARDATRSDSVAAPAPQWVPPPWLDEPPPEWSPQVAPGDAEGARITGGLIESAIGRITPGCTATVIPSKSRRIAVTAAHCVYQPFGDSLILSPTRKVGWEENIRFYPGATGDEAPYGMWRVEKAWIDPNWTSDDSRFDFAFLTIAPRNGKLIQDVVGAQPVSFSHPTTRPGVTVIGYPAQPAEAGFDGRYQRHCDSPAVDSVPVDSLDYSGQRSLLVIVCRMERGSSGGPWLADFTPGRGVGTVVAVTASRALGEPYLFGTPLGQPAQELLTEIDH